ncbi:hypothetical protein QBC32DRAFT_206710 [Pseudoneurospora amorphoporcata]|uniref:Uncharacterized protein n=1 Tax=Pseudoneurospora amorphoporcata TaxID=241081 RepID=A0AAN6SJ50_9PEZI|nr:hypothetical protein QBC32DRAFT_206710 [Pseudoneurospora amorphoporcata]
MDQQHSSGHVTMPRDFRYVVALEFPDASEGPRTPINPFPEDVDFPQIPSPPRPRLKVKRRTTSSQLAASQQFLASVAAADLAVPSIEEPESDPEDFTMRPFSPEPHQDSLSLQIPRARAYSDAGPKTPVPTTMALPPLTPYRYPDWTVGSTSSFESTPEDDDAISRPSTSQSTQTSDSFPSQWSHLSEDDDTDEYDIESASLDGKDTLHYMGTTDLVDFDEPTETLQSSFTTTTPKEANLQPKPSRKKVPWTKPMNDHLWSYYSLYLQDPKVTPFRMGKNCIPPEGVCARVAREAIRTWRGSKAGNSQKAGDASGPGTFMRWPHTQAATRSQLRELCRQKAAAAAKNHRFLSRSVTPMQSVQTPRAQGRFATGDMSMSLTLSTSEHMQPQGPLAQLTRSSLSILEALAPPLEPMPISRGQPNEADQEPERGRLGSPLFGPQPISSGEAADQEHVQPRSYGPSSSASLAAAIGAITTRKRGQTISYSLPGQQSRPTTGRLQSPVRLSRSSAPGKRRNTHSQGGDHRKKTAPAPDAAVAAADPRPKTEEGGVTTSDTRGRRSTEFSSTLGHRFDELFIPRSTSTGTGADVVAPIPSEAQGFPSSISMPAILGLTPLLVPGSQPQAQPQGQVSGESSVQPPPARLGSPLSFSSSFTATRHNHSHVRRQGHGQSVDLGMLGRGPSLSAVMNPNQGQGQGQMGGGGRRSQERKSSEAQGPRPAEPSRTNSSSSSSGSSTGGSGSGNETATGRSGRMADLRQRLREFSRRRGRGEGGRRRSGSPL